MAATGKKIDSLRLSRFESERLVLALLISLAAHLLTWGGYEAGREFGWWQRVPWPAWLHHPAKIQPQNPALLARNSEPITFIEVNPDQATAEAPKNAKFYSSKNSQAANPDANRDTDTPKLNGKQTDAAMTEDVLHPQFSKSTSGANKQEANDQQENKEQKPSLSAGDLTLGKPDDSQQQDRPRTLNQAYAMLANRMPSILMKQNGGVSRQAFVASLDAKETSFGEYDEALIDAVTQQWYDLLDKNGYTFDRPGKVIIVFRLHSDGRITDVKVVEDTADDKFGGIWAILCEASLDNAAPFAAWPSDYLHEQAANYRDLRFQFNYIIP